MTRFLATIGLLVVGSFALPGNDGMVPLAVPKLSPPATLMPGAVTDLRVAMVTDSAATLTWTEVPSGLTVVAKYVIRFGPEATFIWGAGTDVTIGGCGAPIYGSTAAGGRAHACVVSGLSPQTAYRFQVAAYTGTLGTATFGPLSNVATATTAGRVGPALVVRPPRMLDSISVAAVSSPAFGDVRFPFTGRFLPWDQRVAFYDSTGAVVARGYLLLTKP